MLILLLGCGTEETFPAIDVPDGAVVSFVTADGLRLEADWYGNGPDAPAVLLLHGNPVSYDRTSWPVDFVQALLDVGWAVLALDRRGGGASEGDPRAAWEGPDGVLDVVAAVDFLAEQGSTRFAIVASSYGTTSALDYAVMAPGASYPSPVAQAWLSPGDYTETNHTMTQLDQPAMFFGFAEVEEGWVASQRALDPGEWAYRLYDDGQHGTLLFTSNPEVRADLLAFLPIELAD